MTSLLIAAAFAVQFPGGTPNAFTAALAEGTKQNVLLTQGDAVNVAKTSFETDDLTEMARAIRNQTAHAIMPGVDLILSDQLLPKKRVTGGGFLRDPKNSRPIVNFEHIQRPARSPEAVSVKLVELTSKAVVNGTVTFKTEDTEAVELQALGEVFSKPVQYHWIYSDQPIFLSIKNMPERDFMKWIAKAMGARLISTGKVYDFSLDPTLVRQRAIATLNKLSAQASDDSEDRNLYKFRIACLNALTTGQISEALATPWSTVRVQLHPGTSLTAQAVNRVREMEKVQLTYGPNTRASKAAIGLLQRVDPNRPAYLIVDAKFYTRLEIPVLDQKGNPAGVVNL